MAGMLDRVLTRMEKEADRAKAVEPNQKTYEFRVRPSCPPDKRLHITRGMVSVAGTYGFIVRDTDYVPAIACDFENEAETGMPLIFSKPNYYQPIILCYYWRYATDHIDYPEPIFANVIGVQVETAAGAEGQIDGWLNGVDQWYREVVPLTGVVFKNNGTTDVPYAILPIDAVNRGRSYLYRDARSDGGIYP